MKRGGIVPTLALALFSLAAAGSAQERPIVMIDPGHGGDEIGVEDDGLLEKDLVLRIGFALGAELVAQGFDVRFTRTGDYAVEWADRRAQAERAGASLLLMLHIMGKDDRTQHGAEIYVDESNPSSAAAAGLMADAMREMGSEVIVEPRPWPFLQSTSVPTVMIELAHMTHPVERRLVVSPAFHADLAVGLVGATVRFLSTP
jgi:N-acetylmuramoyl-L-alanine amidase